MIEPQLSPNAWSCLATAFAMVLEVPVAHVFDYVGHDGGDVVWPDLPEPYKRRSFHIQELVRVAHLLGYSCTPFEPSPMLASGLALDREPFPVPGHEAVMREAMDGAAGVLVGQMESGIGHAMAWDGQAAINPSDRLRGPVRDVFSVGCFWRVIKSPPREIL